MSSRRSSGRSRSIKARGGVGGEVGVLSSRRSRDRKLETEKTLLHYQCFQNTFDAVHPYDYFIRTEKSSFSPEIPTSVDLRNKTSEEEKLLHSPCYFKMQILYDTIQEK